MPSSKALTNVHVGPGKLHANVASAAADYPGAGTEALLASMISALQQVIAQPTYTTVSLTAGATFTTLDASIYGPVWMGDSGATARSLFDIVESVGSNQRITDTNLFPLYVTSVAGASVGSGFFTTNLLTINFSGPIPASTTYKLLFSRQMTLQSFVKGTIALARNFVPDAGYLENLIYEMKWDGGGVGGGWDSTPSISLRRAALKGLNESYNRTGILDAGATTGSGEGGLIQRTGRAITCQANITSYDYSNPPPDPYLGHFQVKAGDEVTGSTLPANSDGGSGFVGVLQQRPTPSATYLTGAQTASIAGQMEVIERRWHPATGTTIGTGNIKTKVRPTETSGAALNPDGGTGDERRTIRLATGDFFWETNSGDDLSEVAIGADLIEITYPGGEKQVCVITTLFGGPHASSPVPAEDQRRALVRTLTGDSPGFPTTATTGVYFKFIKLKNWSGVERQWYRAIVDSQSDPVFIGWEYHAVAPELTDDTMVTGSQEPDIYGGARFYAKARTRGETGNTNNFRPYALIWGGHNPYLHAQEPRGALRGDGAVECTLLSKRVTAENYGSAGTFSLTWHPSLDGSVLVITSSHASGTVDVTVSLDLDYTANAITEGAEITIIVVNNSLGNLMTITWPSEFIFSGVDGDPMAYNDAASVTMVKYTGVYLGLSGGMWLMSLTTYLGPGD